MRTRLEIDEDLLKQAMAFSPGKAKSEVVNEVLAWYVGRLRQQAESRKPDSANSTLNT